jgi:hypothetical protein
MISSQKATSTQGEVRKKPKLLVYLHHNLMSQANKENAISSATLRGKSLSKMTEDEKLWYKNKLFKEADEISSYLSL